MERTILRTVLVIGLLAAAGLWYLGSGAGERASLFLPGAVSLSVVGGVNWFGRVRTRERWRVAWDAYAAYEREDDRLEPAEADDDLELCLAGGR